MLSKSTILMFFSLRILMPSFAQTSVDSMPLIEKQLETFTFTASYKPTGLDKTVMPVKVLSMQTLKSLGVQNVGEALKYQANLRFQQDNILGSGMSMMGISGENVKILLNGAPISGRLNGNIDLNQLPIENIERIEIIEGPMSVSYGTNALAGVINIITKKSPIKTIDFQANSYYETVGTLNISSSIGVHKDNHSLMVSGGRNFFDGWSAVDTSRFKEWKPKIQYYADGSYQWTKDRTNISLSSNYLNEYILNRGRPVKPYNEYAFDDTYKTTRFTNVVNITHTLHDKWRVNGLLSYSQYERIKNTYYRDLVGASQILTENESDQDTTQFDLIAVRGTIAQIQSKKINYELGFDINHETGSGLRLKNNSQNIGDYAAFASAEWKITEGVTLRPGLRAMYNTSYATPLIPSLNMRWRINDYWTLRASYGKGFRAPSLKELYFFFVDINHNIRGNENLLAEKSHNINTVVSFKKAIDKQIFKLEASTFYNDIDNMITLGIRPSEPNAFSYINIGNLKTMGGQLFGEWVLNNLTVAAGGGYTKRQNKFDYQQFDAETWEYRGNLTYNIPKIGFNLNYWFKHVGNQVGYVLDENGGVLPTFLQAYSMSDIGFSKKITDGKFVVNFGVKNIFNVKNIQSQLISGGHSNGDGFSPLAMGRFFFTKFEIRL